MGQLFFKKPMQLAILAGTKVTTIRRWDRARVKAGARAWAPGVGWLAIDTVERVVMSRMTRQDALADGLPSLTALRAILRDCYPTRRSDGKQWYRVRFHLLSAAKEKPQAPSTRKA